MSQSTVSAAPPSVSVGTPNEFEYRPVPVTAPVALILGLLSTMGLFGLFGLAISVFGIAVGGLCLWKIRRSGGELGGRRLAAIGVTLSAIFLLSGTTLQAYNYHTEVPDGFRRVHFAQDIAKKGFVVDPLGQSDIHPDVKALEGQAIFLKGYMYPTQQTEDLTEFVIVKDNQQCCFGGNPALTDMIYVQLEKGLTADYDQQLVSVAGTFRLATQRADGPVSPVYELDCTYFSSARSLF